jgi:hypothetical protein
MGCVNAIIRGCLSDDETRGVGGVGFSLVPGVGGFLLMRCVVWGTYRHYSLLYRQMMFSVICARSKRLKGVEARRARRGVEFV